MSGDKFRQEVRINNYISGSLNRQDADHKRIIIFVQDWAPILLTYVCVAMKNSRTQWERQRCYVIACKTRAGNTATFNSDSHGSGQYEQSQLFKYSVDGI